MDVVDSPPTQFNPRRISIAHESRDTQLILDPPQVNPATAHCLSSHFVTLEEGQWVIQNGANSAVCLRCIALPRSSLSPELTQGFPRRSAKQSYSLQKMLGSKL